jgi:CubicO group peptidase (beta-lactamase class C family)
MEPEMLRLSNMPPLLLGFLVLALARSAADQRSGDVHAVIDRLLKRSGTDGGPGCAAGVLLKGQVAFEGAAGTMDGHQPLAASTPMYLASVSKQFTAAAVYKLVDSGKIRLDQSVRTIIPELPANTAGITIRQLLNHTSGFRDYSAIQEIADRRGPIDNQGVLQLLSAQRALNFEPGTDYEYSNSAYVILGIVIERISGIAIGEYVRREIFIPLGMNRSWLQGGGTAYKPAQGYMSRDGSLRPAHIPPQTTGDGGMYGSVSDLLRWLQNLERPRNSDEKVFRQLKSRARLKSGEVLPHSSGLFWNRYKGRRTLSHNGSVEGFQADVVHFPKEQLSVVCLCNRGDVDAASVTRQIADAYLGASGPPSNTAQERASRRTLSPDLSGKWESRQGFILSTRIDGAHLIASTAGEEHVMSLDSSRKEFVALSDGFRLLLQRRGQDTLELGWEGDRPNCFTRIRITIPNSPDLNQYAGRFVNGELDLEWNLLVSNRSLLITTPAGWRIPVVQAAPDRFEVGPWFLEFERTEGKISGLALHRERLWKLTFQKVDETPK